MTTPKLILSFATCLTLVACSSSNNSGGGSDSGSATFTDVYSTIISPTCTECHSGAAPAGSLDMSTQALAYQHLLGVTAAGPACQGSDPTVTRVVAGDHTESLLWQKVAGAEKCGSQMPKGEPALPSTEVDLIAQWIDDGATDD